MEPNQGKEFTYFVQAFARNIDEHSECERRKYPERYDPLEASDTIINDAIAKKITPTIRRWLNFCKTNDYGCESGWKIECGGDIGDKKPVIPIDERKMSAFLRRYQENDCYQFHDVNGGAFFNLELVKTLVLYGEMDAVLRVCAHPEVDLKTLWSAGECACGVSMAHIYLLRASPLSTDFTASGGGLGSAVQAGPHSLHQSKCDTLSAGDVG